MKTIFGGFNCVYANVCATNNSHITELIVSKLFKTLW